MPSDLWSLLLWSLWTEWVSTGMKENIHADAEILLNLYDSENN